MPATFPPLADDPTQESLPAEAHLQQIVQSQHFARAETLRKLLLYLWNHRGESLSEYAIATEALGRSEQFDSTTDASVRVQISRLRRKLKEYYADPATPELLQIPMGTHYLVLVENTPAPPMEEPAVSVPDKPLWIRAHLPLLLGGLSIVLAVAVGWLVWSNAQLRTKVYGEQSTNVFWANFLEGAAPVKIILPTPVFFSFDKSPNLRIRSTEVNSFDERAQSASFQQFTRDMGEPYLEQSYTVTADTLAAIAMARYLDSVGQSERVTFDVTRDSSMVVLEQANVVALGTNATLRPMQNYLSSMNFLLAPGEKWVDNVHPSGGEPARYGIEPVGHDREVVPSVIALLPGQGPALKLLMLESRHTSALVSLLTSRAGSRAIEDMLRSHGNPKFFEMVIDTECEGERPLRSWPVALHPYTRPAPPSTL